MKATSVIERYHEATNRLNRLIERPFTGEENTPEAFRSRAILRMEQLQHFLARLGNPQVGISIVHVGGTSGKGSTSTTIAAILTAAGYRTGLHMSPYVQVPSEKLQVNGQLIAPETYCDLADQVLAAHQAWLDDGEPLLTYMEIWNALTWLFFKHEKVEVAVLEVGSGGRFDLTNIITPGLSVITSVSIDHTNTLGSTVPEIAWHKAGIIKPEIPSLTAVTNPAALAVIEEEARLVGSDLTILDQGVEVAEILPDTNGTSWTNTRTGKSWRIGLRGRFQALNGATAVAAAELLNKQGWQTTDEAIQRGLLAARIPGRAELIQDVVPVLLDGAHNPEKISAIVNDVPFLLPVTQLGRRIVVMGVLEAKDATEMVANVVQVADVLIATAPRVLAKTSRAAEGFADLVRATGFNGELHIEPEPNQVAQRALALAKPENGDQIFITGSLYLIGNVREHWYRHDEVVMARTSWPKGSAIA